VSSPYIEKLRTITRCPVCGDKIGSYHRMAVNRLDVSFECGMSFSAGNIRIQSISACQAGSALAAAQMNDEVAAEVNAAEAVTE
jgi:hypothetical protein